MKYSLGYRPDPPHRRTQKDFAHHHFTGATNPTFASLERFEGPILDQNHCGSCTGHGTAQGLHVAFEAQGKPLPFFPSPKGIYANTRAIERATSQVEAIPPLSDDGAMPSDVMLALAQWGIAPMNAPSPQGFYTDVDPTNVNDEPFLGDLETEANTIVVGEYRINEKSSSFVSQVCSAIASGAPVGIGVFVDAAFMAWDPKVDASPLNDVDLNDQDGGGHWLVITGYRTENGVIIFRGANSWSEDWGSFGHFEVTANWLKKACSDCYPFTSAVVK